MNGPAGGAQTIPRALAYWARRTPNATALLSPGLPPVSYAALHDAVSQLASRLRATGLGRGDGIAVLVPEGLDLCVALLAATSVGVAIPVSWPGTVRGHSELLANPIVRGVLAAEGPAGASACAGGGRQLPIVSPTGDVLETGNGFVRGGLCADAHRLRQPPEASDLALILSSSGTTGRPKLVPRTHRAIVSTSDAVIAARTKNSSDCCLSLASLVHSQGFNALMYTLFTGASLVSVLGPGLDIEALPDWLAAFHPTYLSTTPAVLQALASSRGRIVDAVRRSPLRFIHSTAGPLSPKQHSRLEVTFGVPILNGYGMSEAPGIAAEPFPWTRRVPGSVGPPMCEIRFVNAAGDDVPAQQIGEIAVRGPRVFAGYLDDETASAAAFLPDGWFRTGDLGSLDEGGLLHLTGRLHETINRGGETIAPGAIEDILAAHPAVAEAAVFGVPDNRLGEDLVVAVVPKPDAALTPRALRAWMLDHLPPSRTPRRVWLVPRIPRTATGKVRRGELRRRWNEEHP